MLENTKPVIDRTYQLHLNIFNMITLVGKEIIRVLIFPAE